MWRALKLHKTFVSVKLARGIKPRGKPRDNDGAKSIVVGRRMEMARERSGTIANPIVVTLRDIDRYRYRILHQPRFPESLSPARGARSPFPEAG